MSELTVAPLTLQTSSSSLRHKLVCINSKYQAFPPQPQVLIFYYETTHILINLMVGSPKETKSK